jgi:hypothetical protein
MKTLLGVKTLCKLYKFLPKKEKSQKSRENRHEKRSLEQKLYATYTNFFPKKRNRKKFVKIGMKKRSLEYPKTFIAYLM